MDLDVVLLSRIQFAFVITFHIIFPAFTIGLAAWLATIEGMSLPARCIGGCSTGSGSSRSRSGWGSSRASSWPSSSAPTERALAEKTGSIQGPLLGYEAFTAFLAGSHLLRRHAVGAQPGATLVLPPGLLHGHARHYGVVLWILANNSWMQVPVGHEIVDGEIILADWREIVRGGDDGALAAHAARGVPDHGDVRRRNRGVRAPRHPSLRGPGHAALGPGVAAVLIPVQLFFGHLTGKCTNINPPSSPRSRRAGSRSSRSEVWLAWPDEARKKNLFAIETPGVGSFIATGSWTAAVPGLSDFPEDDWPPVVIPFFGFRIMVGMGLRVLAVSLGNVLRWRGRLETSRWFPWPTFLAFLRFRCDHRRLVHRRGRRQPWVVYGLLRTTDAHTPTPTTSDVLTSLIGYVVVYAVIYSFGLYYIYHLLHDGPTDLRTRSPAPSPCVRWPPQVRPKPRPARPDRPGGDRWTLPG